MRHVLVARPLAQSSTLIALLQAAGFRASHCPLMAIVPQPDALQALPAQASAADDWVFVSPTAIDLAWPVLQAQDLSAKRLFCVGQASAKRLMGLSGQNVHYPQHGSDSEALLTLAELGELSGRSVLIIRGSGGRALLADSLRQRGASVSFAELYRREDGKPDWTALDQQAADAIVITSSEMAEQLFRLAGSSRVRALQCLLYCVPHPRIAARLAALGAIHIVTTQANDSALVAGLQEWFCHYP
ncbi:uroporphyrinogen-III synthase [Neisseriaceae bacterium TC5R-5]|nr:uroporphyrinogen-III synthase [Neisseriaceae bacterium TC5R-5]